MVDGEWLGYLAFGALLFSSAFFSAAETALIGSKRLHLQNLAEQGVRPAKTAVNLLRDPGNLLATLLVGNNIVNVAAATLGAALFGPLAATAIVTVAVLMVGEIPPKTMAARWPERLSLWVAYPVRGLQVVLSPLVRLASTVTLILLWPFTRRFGGPSDRFFSREEIRSALDESQDAGELEPGEVRMVQEVLELTKVKIRDLMIPLAEAACLDIDMSREQVLKEVRRRRFSRYPLYKKGVPRPIGLLHVKDLLLSDETVPWHTLQRALFFKHDDMDADDLLRNMQIARFHMAAVVDREDEVVGFITMEMLLEEIVGEITDEHERERPPILSREIGVYLVRPDLMVGDVALLLNMDLGCDDPDMSIDDFFKKQSDGVSASVLHIGHGTIQPKRGGYLVTLHQGSAYDEHGSRELDEDIEAAELPPQRADHD